MHLHILRKTVSFFVRPRKWPGFELLREHQEKPELDCGFHTRPVRAFPSRLLVLSSYSLCTLVKKSPSKGARLLFGLQCCTLCPAAVHLTRLIVTSYLLESQGNITFSSYYHRFLSAFFTQLLVIAETPEGI